MNLLLHGIGSQDFEPIVVADALAADPGERFELILTNPPFGKKSSTTIAGGEGKVSKERDTVERDDFWATTSNKQLNFVQHVAIRAQTGLPQAQFASLLGVSARTVENWEQHRRKPAGSARALLRVLEVNPKAAIAPYRTGRMRQFRCRCIPYVFMMAKR